MKRSYLLVLLLAALLLTGCGTQKKEAAAPDMQAAYTAITQRVALPEMVALTDNRRLDVLGIAPEDCRQAMTLLCGDSVRADEIWLIEAADETAAAKIEKLAQQRVADRLEQLKDYLPDQYAVVRNAKIKVTGRCVALFISPEADTMVEVFRAAA
jgi:hypothetical protein